MGLMTTDESDQAVADFLKDYHSGVCHHCKTEIQQERQVGRCVYALPCQHRLWQGKARTRKELEQCQSKK
jgi:hypothetical protein